MRVRHRHQVLQLLCFSKPDSTVSIALDRKWKHVLVKVPRLDCFRCQSEQLHANFRVQVRSENVSYSVPSRLSSCYVRAPNATMLSSNQRGEHIIGGPGQDQKRRRMSASIFCRIDMQCHPIAPGDVKAGKLHATIRHSVIKGSLWNTIVAQTQCSGVPYTISSQLPHSEPAELTKCR